MKSESHREFERKQVRQALMRPAQLPPDVERQLAAGRERERQLIAEAIRAAERNRR